MLKSSISTTSKIKIIINLISFLSNLRGKMVLPLYGLMQISPKVVEMILIAFVTYVSILWEVEIYLGMTHNLDRTKKKTNKYLKRNLIWLILTFSNLMNLLNKTRFKHFSILLKLYPVNPKLYRNSTKSNWKYRKNFYKFW